MSGDPHEIINIRDPRTGDGYYPPQSAPNQESQGMSNFVDGSGPIFSMYLERAEEEDKKMAENTKADADGILIFTGLFSAAVASLISVSIQDIRPNPQDTSNFYLANIYQTVADTNPANISNPLPSFPPPFSPPNYAVWVNALWFMSLVISLTCALLATLLQQWARRYLKVTQPHYSPHKRARIRSFFFEGANKYLISFMVDALPTLLHVSLFLFFGGLVVFLCNVDLTIFKLVLSWVCFCTAVYGFITFIPIFRYDSPYSTPLTSLAWPTVTGTSFVVFRVILWFSNRFGCFSYETYYRFRNLAERYRKLLVRGMQKAAEETALNSPSEIDVRAFMWTFDSLDEDHELERFFFGLPGFRSSKVVDDPLPRLSWEQKGKLLNGLIGLSDRTFTSDLLPESVKSRRSVICAKALGQVEISSADLHLLQEILSGERWFEPGESVGIANLLRDWGYTKDENTPVVIPAIVSSFVASARRRDDLWFAIASYDLGVPESVLRDYAAHGDSLSLAILVHVTRQQFSHFGRPFWSEYGFSKVLEAASKFDVQDTSPELQHEFCALWNQIVLKVQDDNNRQMASLILGRIRNVYTALHNDTDSAPTRFSPSTGDEDHILRNPSSYPVCNVTGHTHDDTLSTSFSRTVPLYDTALVHASLASPDLPSSVQAPRGVDESLTISPPLENDITSQDPVTAHVIQGGIDTSTTMAPLSTFEPSASTPPPTSLASTSPSGAVRKIADRRNSLDVPEVPSLLSPIPVLDSMHLTGPQSYPTTGSDHASSPESHSPLVVSASPGPSRPRLSFAPDIGSATEGEGSAKATTLHKERDALDTPTPIAVRENIMAT